MLVNTSPMACNNALLFLFSISPNNRPSRAIVLIITATKMNIIPG